MREARVYNLKVTNTREGIILTRLLEKLRTIERQLAGYAPNILGLTTRDVGMNMNPLSDLIMNVIAEDTPPEVTADHLEQVMEHRRRMYDQIESTLFMPLRHFDKGEADRVIARSHALTPSNAAIESFVCRYFDANGGKIENTRQKGVVRIRTPREVVDGQTVLDEYARGTFDKETAFRHKPRDVQFIAFGHPLLEMMIRQCRDQSGGLHGIVCVKRLPTTTLKPPGEVLCNYTVRYADAHDHTFFEELFLVFVSLDGEASLERGQVLVREGGEGVPNPQADDRVAELAALIDELEQAAQWAAAGEAEHGYQRLQAEINWQADACLESLETFREAKRQRLQLSIHDYQQRLLFGEDMDIAIRRARYELERLDEECERRRRQIEESRHVQVHAPGLLNVALLLT